MRVEETREEDVTILSFTGEIDTYAVSDLKDLLKRLLGDGHLKLVLDLSDLSYLCSAGIATLITMSERVHSRGGRMAICGIQGQVKETLRILQLDRTSTVLGMFRSLEDALEDMQEP